MNKANTPREIVTVDDRRKVIPLANARPMRAAARISHELFIQNTLKSMLGWPERARAPASVVVAGREMSAPLRKRDLEIGRKMALVEEAAKVQA